jgi:hypothetical protein
MSGEKAKNQTSKIKALCTPQRGFFTGNVGLKKKRAPVDSENELI